MNFVLHLAISFLKKEKWTALALFLVSLCSSVLQANVMTNITSNIITFAQNKNSTLAFQYFNWYIFAVIAFILVYYLWLYLQNQLMTKIKPWIRTQLVHLLLMTNNKTFSDTNFSKLNSPINRILDMYYFIAHTILDYMLPNLVYLLIVSIYFAYMSPMYGLVFVVGNLLLTAYWLLNMNDILKANDEYEKTIVQTDMHLIDLLSNIDKVIYRGQTEPEMNRFSTLTHRNFTTAQKYYGVSNYHTTIMLSIIYGVILFSVWYLIRLYFKNKMSITLFITSFTILLLYREKMSIMIEILPEFVDFIGRAENVLFHFQHVNDNYLSFNNNSNYANHTLDFKKIQFHNVSYKYNINNNNVFENRNFLLKTDNHQIIGITGRSGNGKSTFIKLLLRMYECTSGTITIDDVDIKELDPNYIRSQITYVNQNSKLFDRKVIDNMQYGCANKEICDHFLDKILKYPNITKLYKNTDIKNKDAGLMGENLSGGQRQVVNMIGGLINPSKILVLDEPTNALDPDLKKEVLSLIQDFSYYKQAIIIITHDKDVFPLFTQQVQM
jgi:ABC-type multidrug transport system fused ATPase/permease subunit